MESKGTLQVAGRNVAVSGGSVLVTNWQDKALGLTFLEPGLQQFFVTHIIISLSWREVRRRHKAVAWLGALNVGGGLPQLLNLKRLLQL